MPLTSAIASNSFSTGMQVLRAQMAASGGGEITVGGQTVRIIYSETDGRFLAKRMVAFWRVGAITVCFLDYYLQGLMVVLKRSGI